MVQLPRHEKSYWREAYPESAVYPAVKTDMEVDVVVVGAGITGLTAAYLLKKSGLRVAVLEQRTIGSGTTGRTTGKVTQHNLIYADMTRRLGKDAALAYAQLNQAAIGQVRDIIAKEKIDCQWHDEDNYIFTTDPRTVKTLKEEVAAAAYLGLPATFVDDTALPFTVVGAVKFSGQGTFNAQNYLLGLAKAVHGDGSFVFENSKVTAFKDGVPPCVKTDDATVSAKSIIVATKIPSFPLAARFGYAAYEHPTESFGIACKVKRHIPGMYISPDRQHHSVLPVDMGGEPGILVVGAGGNTPGVRLGKEKHFRQLAQYAQKYFDVTGITHKWADMDYLPYDYYPLVGKVYPWSKRMYQATGYMKWGLTNGTVAAHLLHDEIIGTPDPRAHHFAPHRMRTVLNIPRAAVLHFLK